MKPKNEAIIKMSCIFMIHCAHSTKNTKFTLNRIIMTCFSKLIICIVPNKTINQSNRVYNGRCYFIRQGVFIFSTSEISAKSIHRLANSRSCYRGHYGVINTCYLCKLNKKFMYRGCSKAP